MPKSNSFKIISFRLKTLVHSPFPRFKTFLESIFWDLFELRRRSHFDGIDVRKMGSLQNRFDLREEKKSHGARSGECEGCSKVAMFFSARIFFRFEFLPQGQTVNQTFYKEIFRLLVRSVRDKRWNLWEAHAWALHHDSTPAHTIIFRTHLYTTRKNIYEGSETVVRCAVGTTESFKVKVGLHQGLALNPFLFVVTTDRLTDEVTREPQWTMLFADDIVIYEETREEVDRRLKC